MAKKPVPPFITHDEVMRDFLSTPENLQNYLELSIEEYLTDGDTKAFLESLRHVAMAKGGMAKLAKKTGLNRESLYKALSPRGNPQFRTIINILHSLGMRVRFEAVR